METMADLEEATPIDFIIEDVENKRNINKKVIFNVPNHFGMGTLPKELCSKMKFELWCPLIITKA
jgi:hypothetical protein